MADQEAMAAAAPDGAATAVTNATTTLASHGRVDRVFPLASVTKPLAAYAVLVAVDQGRVELDDDVDGEGRTVAHLLAHASGLGPDEAGPHTAPERRRAYSNHGFEVLGSYVEDAVRRPLASWLQAQVLLPLGMHDTALEGSPAKDAHGTVEDLLRFARELLAPTLVEPELAERARSPQWPDLVGVLPGYGRQDPNPWGLGLEVRGSKDPHWTDGSFPPSTVGHFGQSGSYLWVSPDDGCAAAYLGPEPFGQWAVDAWPLLTRVQLELAREAG